MGIFFSVLKKMLEFSCLMVKCFLYLDEKACQENAALADQMEKITVLLEETESSHHKADVENHLLARNLKSIRRNHERQTENKLKQEKQILELLQNQVTTDQASKIQGRNIQEVQNKRRDLERIMNNTEVQLSESIFELEKLKGDMFRSRNHAEELRVIFKSIFYDFTPNFLSRLILNHFLNIFFHII